MGKSHFHQAAVSRFELRFAMLKHCQLLPSRRSSTDCRYESVPHALCRSNGKLCLGKITNKTVSTVGCRRSYRPLQRPQVKLNFARFLPQRVERVTKPVRWTTRALMAHARRVHLSGTTYCGRLQGTSSLSGAQNAATVKSLGPGNSFSTGGRPIAQRITYGDAADRPQASGTGAGASALPTKKKYHAQGKRCGKRSRTKKLAMEHAAGDEEKGRC